MNVLTILTTATPRPDVHRVAMLDVVKQLIENQTQDKINWYINIDVPAMFSKDEVEKTVNEINVFSTKYQDLQVHILTGHKEAHFGAAARRLYMTADVALDKVNCTEAFLWLEDDWMLVNDNSFFKEVKSFFEQSYDIFLCTSQKYISGPPFFFKRDFFDIIKNNYFISEVTLDPELMLFECVKKRYDTDEKRYEHPFYKRKDVFKDIGREWRANRSIEKLNKYNAELHTNTWVTSHEAKMEELIQQIRNRQNGYEENITSL